MHQSRGAPPHEPWHAHCARITKALALHVLNPAWGERRSQTDCGEVENSAEARGQDEPVLRAELDLDKLAEAGQV